MTIRYTPYFEQRLKKKLHQHPEIREKLKKQIRLLISDLRYPGLKVHKLQGKRASQYAFWIENNFRITFLIYADYYLFTDIITHDEY